MCEGNFITTQDKEEFGTLCKARAQSLSVRSTSFFKKINEWLNSTDMHFYYEVLKDKKSSKKEKDHAIEQLDAIWQKFQEWKISVLKEHNDNFILEPIPWFQTIEIDKSCVKTP